MAESFQITSLFAEKQAVAEAQNRNDESSSPFQSLRENAKTFLAKEGIPHKKIEAWRFTPLSSLFSTQFQKTQTDDSTSNKNLCSEWEKVFDQPSAKVIWNNQQTSISVEKPSSDFSIHTLSDLQKTEPDLQKTEPDLQKTEPDLQKTEPDLQKTEPDLQKTEPDLQKIESAKLLKTNIGRETKQEHFTALNDLYFSEVISLRIHKNAIIEKPIVIFYPENTIQNTITFPRLLADVENGAQAHIIEIFGSQINTSNFTNQVSEITVGEGAVLQHTRIDAQQGFLVSNVHVKQQKQSQYESNTFTLGGKLSRLNLNVKLEGQGASCKLNGVYHAGDHEIVDHHMYVEHLATHCDSAQNFRGIVQGKGHAVFDGIVKVHRGAQQTSAHQQNKNLLLSDEGVVHTKPHLEIDADDVSCSHGATVGTLDEAQLFYLRSRGLPEEESKALLTWAFVSTLINQIEDGPLREKVSKELKQKIRMKDTP